MENSTQTQAREALGRLLCQTSSSDQGLIYYEQTGANAAVSYQPEVGRRMVACWNACEGIPTDALEVGRMSPGAFDCNQSLRAQLDELQTKQTKMAAVEEEIAVLREVNAKLLKALTQIKGLSRVSAEASIASGAIYDATMR